MEYFVRFIRKAYPSISTCCVTYGSVSGGALHCLTDQSVYLPSPQAIPANWALLGKITTRIEFRDNEIERYLFSSHYLSAEFVGHEEESPSTQEIRAPFIFSDEKAQVDIELPAAHSHLIVFRIFAKTILGETRATAQHVLVPGNPQLVTFSHPST